MTLDSALLLYKGTILPILEYADFVYDFNIKYISKRIQTIQNTGLYVVYNQHISPYDVKTPMRLYIEEQVYRGWPIEDGYI